MQTIRKEHVYLHGAPLIHSYFSFSMKFSRKVLVSLASVGLIATAAAPVFAASPVSSQSSPQDRREILIQALVQRFNLNKSDVQQFFQDQESQRFNEVLTRLGERLSDEVTQGHLTEAQKNAILVKAKEVKAKHDALRSLSEAERETQMKQYRSELEAWVTQQGIDKRYLRDLVGGGHHGPRDGRHGIGNQEGRRGGPGGLRGMMRGTNGFRTQSQN